MKKKVAETIKEIVLSRRYTRGRQSRKKREICGSFKHLMILPHGCKNFIAIGLTNTMGLSSCDLSANFTHLNRFPHTFTFSRPITTYLRDNNRTILIYQFYKSFLPIHRRDWNQFLVCYHLKRNSNPEAYQSWYNLHVG